MPFAKTPTEGFQGAVGSDSANLRAACSGIQLDCVLIAGRCVIGSNSLSMKHPQVISNINMIIASLEYLSVMQQIAYQTNNMSQDYIELYERTQQLGCRQATF